MMRSENDAMWENESMAESTDNDHLIGDMLQTAGLSNFLPEGTPRAWGNAQNFLADKGFDDVTAHVSETLPVGHGQIRHDVI